jgi:homoserine kinase
MNSGLKVIAPASLSNLACGFDVLGMALTITGDEIIGHLSDRPGVRIKTITGHKKNIPLQEDQNIAAVTARALLHHLGDHHTGIELKIHKNIPAGSGMGSSASSACAAAVLVNELTGANLEKRDLLRFALEGEAIASGGSVGDNIVASMIGGLILVRDIGQLDYHRIYTPKGLFVAVLLPDVFVSTLDSRSILAPVVPLHDVVRQTANLGAFVIGMEQGDLDLIRRSMTDHIIEPQRKHLIPHFDRIKENALEMGALACSISGAGPAVFALCQEKTMAEEIALSMQTIYDQDSLPARSFVAGINHEGTSLL